MVHEEKDDPFALFEDGSTGDAEDEIEGKEGASSRTLRDPSCGVLVFHDGIEKALLQYVKSNFPPTLHTCSPDTHIIQLVDEYCLTRHWMMHVGPEKGDILDDFLKETVDAFCLTQTSSGKLAPFLVFEVGTYCGYSTIRMARTIRNKLMESNHHSENHDERAFHIISVDISERNQAVAQEIIDLAGYSSSVTLALLKNPEQNPMALCTTLKQTIQKQFPHKNAADFVFLDHDKSFYYTDVLQLEQSRLIQQFTSVAADNVLFFQLNKYREHMNFLEQQGVVTTSLKVSRLEYVTDETASIEAPHTDLRDGLELTQYLKDPPMSND